MTREKKRGSKTKRLIGKLRGKFSTGKYIEWFMHKHRPARFKADVPKTGIGSGS